jgi:hypothetical protein
VAFGAPTFIRRWNVRFVWIVNSRRWWHSVIKLLRVYLFVCVCVSYNERSPRVNDKRYDGAFCALLLLIYLFIFLIEKKCVFDEKEKKSREEFLSMLFLSSRRRRRSSSSRVLSKNTSKKKKSSPHHSAHKSIPRRRKDKKHAVHAQIPALVFESVTLFFFVLSFKARFFSE